MTAIYVDLAEEITQIITNYIMDFGDALMPEDDQVQRIVLCAERLNEICNHDPETVSYELYRNACDCHETLQNFLLSVNQRINDREFKQSALGILFVQAGRWRQDAHQRFHITIDEAWNLLAPAIPDHLEDLGNGQFEARWWKPVPLMDVEILKYTEGVQISETPYEPKNLPGGLAVRFAIVPESVELQAS